MNELIKKFAISSAIASEHNGELVSPYVQPCDMSEEVQEFAELVVRQCVESIIELHSTAIDNKWDLDETFHMILDNMVEQFDMQHIFRS